MIEQDTVKLLRECDAGIKMGISSIDDVLEYTKMSKLRDCLVKSRDKHEQLKEELQRMLGECHDEGKEPNLMAKSMSWVKTNVKLVLNESDQTIAELMTDGCDMGVKSLNQYLNQYQAADEKAKGIAKRIIREEEKLREEMKGYL